MKENYDTIVLTGSRSMPIDVNVHGFLPADLHSITVTELETQNCKRDDGRDFQIRKFRFVGNNMENITIEFFSKSQ